MPPKPSEQTCEWCASPAVVCREIRRKKARGQIGISQYLCACNEHRGALSRMIDAKAGLT